MFSKPLRESDPSVNMARLDGLKMPGRPLKERMAKGEVVLGVGLEEVGTPIVGKLMARAGFDWIHFEMEHVQVNPESFFNMVSLVNSENVPVVVKTPELSRELVSKSMDAGASGIRLPWTETRQEVKGIIDWVKYPPEGKRAIYFGANADYRGADIKDYMKEANRSTIIMPHVETKTGIENIDDIASVKQVDVVIVGPYDLSISLGIPGKFEDPIFMRAMDKLIAACEKNGVVPGITVDNFEGGKKWIERGMRCIECSSDRNILFGGAKAIVDQFGRYLKKKQGRARA